MSLLFDGPRAFDSRRRRPGVLGIHLIEALSGSIINQKYNKNPKNDFQKFENQGMFLGAVKSKGLTLVNIGPEDLGRGDRKLVLGLTWTLILRYEIQRYGADELELLKWVKETTSGYEGVKVTTWGESFADGKAFAAICHNFAPNALDFKQTSAKGAVPCLTAAFECANDTFGVAQLLDPADVAASGTSGRTDDKSLITYVAKLKQGCLNLREAQTAELAEQRAAEARAARAKEAAVTKAKLDDLVGRAGYLTGWCNDKASGFRAAQAHPAVQAGLEPAPLQARLDELLGFRSEQKPPKADDKAELARLHAEVGARVAADKAAAIAAGEAPDESQDAALAAAAPGPVGEAWQEMEAAEYAYEEALQAKLAAAIQKASEDATDAMAEPALKEALAILGWTTDKTAELTNGLAPSALGDTPEEVAAKRAALAEWMGADGEKERKKAAKAKVQDALREINVRRAQEGREPLSGPSGAELEKAWGDLEAANAALEAALTDREKQLARQRAVGETDAMTDEADGLAKEWLAKVSAKGADFGAKVKNADLGSSAAETQALLDAYRTKHVDEAKPAWAAQKGDIEARRAAIDERRLAEGREAKAAWEPPAEAMGDAWGGLLRNGNEYEQALLAKLGQLQAEEAERLRKKAAAEGAANTLSELLPPLLKRAKAVDAAKERAAEAAAAAEAEALPWAQKKADEMRELLENLTGGPAAPTETPKAHLRSLIGLAAKDVMKPKLADAAKAAKQPKIADAISAAEAALARYAEDEKPEQAAKRRALVKAVGDATAAQQVQRYNGTPGGASPPLPRKKSLMATLGLPDLPKFGSKEDATPTALAAEGPTAVLAAVEGAWAELEARERSLRATLVRLHQEHTASAVEKLAPIASQLISRHEPFRARAEGAMAGARAVVGQQTALAARIEALKAEVARQRKLAAERLLFGAAVKELEASVVEADERLGFPVEELDTAAALRALIASGTKAADALTPPPEGASAEARAEGDALRARWAAMLPTLSLAASERELTLAAQVKAAPLLAEASEAKENLEGWYGRCTDLLVLHAPDAAPGAAPLVLAMDDVEKALGFAEAQMAEGDSHARRLSDLRNEVASLGLPPPPPAEGVSAIGDTPDEAAEAIDHIKALATSLRSAVGAVPPKAEPERVVEALRLLEDGTGAPLQAAALHDALPASLAAFLLAHVAPGAQAGTLQCDGFNPFPLDAAAFASRPLPETALNTVTHGHAVLEHLNKARTDPKGYAAALKQSLQGCFEGNVFAPPWGGRYQTREGEASLTSLVGALEKASALPPLRLLPKVCEVAQLLAEAIGKGDDPSASPLEARLDAKGKSSGVGFEIIGMGMREPQGIVAQMLMCDGDAERRNRSFLLHPDITVGGFGLGDHPEHGAVGTLTLLQLFAATLGRAATETCEGGAVPSKAFLEVVDAVPSAQVRTIVSDALSAAKKVTLVYTMTAVEIVVDDGATSRLEWGA